MDHRSKFNTELLEKMKGKKVSQLRHQKHNSQKKKHDQFTTCASWKLENISSLKDTVQRMNTQVTEFEKIFAKLVLEKKLMYIHKI